MKQNNNQKKYEIRITVIDELIPKCLLYAGYAFANWNNAKKQFFWEKTRVFKNSHPVSAAENEANANHL